MATSVSSQGSVDYHWKNSSTTPIVCYTSSISSSLGVWNGDNPLNHTIPLFILQLLLIVITSRVVAILLQPFRQPRYISEIIGGLVLGPTVLGRFPGFLMTLFPYRSLPILEVVAHFGIIYYVFIIGLEIDPTTLKRSRKYATFAAACMFFPFAVGLLSGLFVSAHLAIESKQSAFLTFLGVALSITSFSVLARTLTEHKLIHSNMGLTTLSTAMFMDSWAWILLSMAFSMSSGKPSATMWTMISALVFVLASIKLVKPLVMWMVQQEKSEVLGELGASIILVGVMAWSLLADAIGINAVSGAFIYGLMIPYGLVGVALEEQVGNLVEGLLMPLFYAACGLRCNLYSITNMWSAVVLAVVVLVSAAGKVGACITVGHFYEMPYAESFAMGLLMTTKGVTEMVVLKIGRDSEVLSEQAYSVLVMMSALVTAMVTPLLRLLVMSSRGQVTYQRRTILWSDPHAELRMLLCVHNTRNVTSMLGLLEAAHPSKRSPVLIFSLHLIELTCRAAAMLVVHDTQSSSLGSPRALVRKASLGRSRNTIQALECYAQRTAGITIQPLTAVSAYSTMHEDVCGVAEDNCVAFIVLPFHKQPTVDGDMQVTNPAIRTLNESVLAAAPCSVAVLIDRGLSGAGRMAAGQHRAYHVAVLFFGGPDDREALALASRMAENPAMSLTVFRFVPDLEMNRRPAVQLGSSHRSEREVIAEEDGKAEGERWVDEACIEEFRMLYDGEGKVGYREEVVVSSEETVGLIRATEGQQDLYVVGRCVGQAASPLMEGLTEWCECPELGPIGDMLASKDFGASASVLVVQQGKKGAPAMDTEYFGMPRKPR